MSGPLPVREYADGAEMLARYAKLRQATWAPRHVPETTPAFRPQKRREASAPKHEDQIPPPDREITLAAFKQGRAVALAGKKPLADMLRITCVATRVTSREIISESRSGPRVKARQIAMYLMVRVGGHSLNEAGRALGGRDHSTVLHGCRKLDMFALRLGLSKCTDPVLVAEKLWDCDWSLFREAAR